MPYKKQPPPLRTTPDRNYWINFLRSQGIISEIPIEEPISEAPSESMLEKSSESPGRLSADMVVFVHRVADKLMPGDPTLREKYRKGLEDCLLGKKEFNDWFNNAGADRGIHSFDLLKILHDALDGLVSPEAGRLRQEYQLAMRKLSSL